MNIKEFSNEFDILYNNIMSNAAPGLDEYEKSVFLTKSLEALIIETYTGRNTTGYSFEATEETRRYLSNLRGTERIIPNLQENEEKLTSKSTLFTIPEDVWFITYESATLTDPKLGCLNNTEVTVYPALLDELFRIKDNPFRGPSSTRVLRVDNNSNIIELISDYSISRYLISYIKRPSPIILTNLLELGVSINNKQEVTECKLHDAVHNKILQGAVYLAKIAYESSFSLSLINL